ncbi:hypothetical protein IAS59_004432 [Cryptococcus gattii]
MRGVIKFFFLSCSFISLGYSQKTGTLSTSLSDRSGVPDETATIDPRVFVLSKDFLITNIPTTREYTFNITKALASPDGYEREVIAINGMFPGPVIEANTGDTIIVHVNNGLDEGQGLHWHGLRQKDTALMDGVPGITQCPIRPGGSFTYNFTISDQFGTYWWHSHYSNSMADGLFGPLIVHSVDEPIQRGRDYDEDRVVFVTDWMHDDSETIVNALLSPEGYRGSTGAPQGDSVLINGLGRTNCTATGSPSCTNPPFPEIPVPVNSRIRLRFISGSSHVFYRMSLDNHPLEVVETDGTAVYGPVLHEVSISSGERYSAIINTFDGNVGDAFWLRATSGLGCLNHGVPQVGLAIVRYTGQGNVTTDEPHTEAWPDLAGPDVPCVGLDQTYPLTPRISRDASQTVLQTHVLNSQLGAFVDVFGKPFQGYGFNNVTYQNQINNPLLRVVQGGGSCNSTLITNATFPDLGEVNIILNNLDAKIPHPYHLHGNEIQLLARGTGSLSLDDLPHINLNLDNPLRKDTFWMEGGSWVVMRLVTDNPGVWALHCHIGWHLAKGKLAVVVVQPQEIEQIRWPQPWLDLCNGTDPNAFGPARRSFP